MPICARANSCTAPGSEKPPMPSVLGMNGEGFLVCHMVWFWSLVCVGLASASITFESLTCEATTESVRNQDA
jgi:hypothetical protein